MGMLKEFREFAMKGSIVELAVAVVLGGAFGEVVKSLTNAFIMPLIGMILGKGGVGDLTITAGNTVFPVGLFLQSVINFILIAFVLFLIIRTMNSMRKKDETAIPPTPEDTILLREIRDALRK